MCINSPPVLLVHFSLFFSMIPPPLDFGDANSAPLAFQIIERLLQNLQKNSRVGSWQYQYDSVERRQGLQKLFEHEEETIFYEKK